MSLKNQDPYLRVENICFDYPSSDFVLAVENAAYYPGRIYAILGPNGSGKSTYLYLITGLLTPRRGRVFYCSKSIFPTSKLTSMFFVLPNENYKRLDELILQYSILRDENEKAVRERAVVLLERLKLQKELMKRIIAKLSTGQQKLMFNILGLALNPKVLVFDEPFSEIDPHRAVILTEIFKEFCSRDERMIIMTAHELGVLNNFNDLQVDFILGGHLVKGFDSADLKNGMVLIRTEKLPLNIREITAIGPVHLIPGSDYETINKEKYPGEYIYDLNQLSKLYLIGEKE